MRPLLCAVIGISCAIGAPNGTWAAPEKKPETAPVKTPADRAVHLAQKVQGFYDATETVEAEFIQTYFQVALSRTLEQRGHLSFKKPRKLRWSYKTPRPIEWIVRDDTVWWYEPEESQVIVRHGVTGGDAEQSVAFLTGEGDLSETFVISLGKSGAHGLPEALPVLTLEPKKGATYRTLLLAVDPSSGAVRGTVLIRNDGNVNRYIFRNIQVGQPIPDERFAFTPPKGTEVIER